MLMYGLVLWPARTRLVASIFAAITLSDTLHRAYERTAQSGDGQQEGNGTQDNRD